MVTTVMGAVEEAVAGAVTPSHQGHEPSIAFRHGDQHRCCMLGSLGVTGQAVGFPQGLYVRGRGGRIPRRDDCRHQNDRTKSPHAFRTAARDSSLGLVVSYRVYTGGGPMGFRFRRSFRLLPGVRVNLGKRSASLSVGVRGLHYTVGPAGRQITAGVPGTGLSYTHRFKRGGPAQLPPHQMPPSSPLGVQAAPVQLPMPTTVQQRPMSTNKTFAIAGTAVGVGTFVLITLLSKLFHVG